jgi:hypothetical protein
VSARRRRKKLTRADKLAEQHRWKLSLLREFVAKHGWSEVRAGTVVPPGVNLFTYVHARRVQNRYGRRGKPMPRWLVAACEAVPGWSWDPNRDKLRHGVDTLRAFVKRHGWQLLHVDTVVDGVRLSHWCATRRQEHKRGALERWLITALEAIPDWSWDPRTTHYVRNLGVLRDHVARNGWDAFRMHTIARDGTAIGKWANHIRHVHREGRLPAWLERELVAISGWTWEPARDRQLERITAVRRLYERRGPDAVTAKTMVGGFKIGTWINNARSRYRDGSLSPETVRELEQIPGWSWGSTRATEPSRRRTPRATRPRSRARTAP